jgi:2-methylisocitrate lyase-like PEP mutase family enzyme
VYAAAHELHGESALLDDLVASSPSFDALRARAAGDPVAASNEALRSALAILQARATPVDVDAYKGFVLAVVQTVAEAHREGGVAGIGGEEVSEREQAALDEIGALLGQ